MKRPLKYAIAILSACLISACGSPAKIATPSSTLYQSETYAGKSIKFDVIYSQPKPRMLGNDEELLPPMPLEKQTKSYFAKKQFENFRGFLASRVPEGMKPESYSNSDYTLKMIIVAKDRAGPVDAVYKGFKSIAMAFITFGFSPSYYSLDANYSIEYSLYKQRERQFWKRYEVRKSVDHEKVDFASPSNLENYSRQLFHKTLAQTLNDFFRSADLDS